MNRFQKYSNRIITTDLLLKDHYIHFLQFPHLTQISLNTGIGLKAILDKKQILTALLSMQLIAGQKPVITRAKKSIDKFQVRKNMPIGCLVTLRKSNLFEFMDRFINSLLPTLDSSDPLFSSRYFTLVRNLKAHKDSSSLFLRGFQIRKEQGSLYLPT